MIRIIKTVISVIYYFLKNSFILNSKITFYIFNDFFKFINFKGIYYGDKVYVKNTFLPIIGYGNVLIRPIKGNGL